jgi:hypothetical protein
MQTLEVLWVHLLLLLATVRGDETASSSASWLVLDFGRLVTLDGFRLYSHGDGIHDTISHYLQSAKKSGSTGSLGNTSWGKVVGRFQGAAGSSAPQDFVFPATTAREWRWVVTGVVPSHMCPTQFAGKHCQPNVAEIMFHEKGADRSVYMLNTGTGKSSIVIDSSGGYTAENQPWEAVDGVLLYEDWKYGWDASWISGPPDAPPACNYTIDSAELRKGLIRGGPYFFAVSSDADFAATASPDGCAALCCNTTGCESFSLDIPWDSSLGPWFNCSGKACCSLSKTRGAFKSYSGPMNITTGVIGNPIPPAPTPPPPGGCVNLGGTTCVDPFSSGTPGGITHSYDCEVRKHAWEFAKVTLPWRGSFKTAFDALQLQKCDNINASVPATEDAYAAPKFSTPTQSAVIYVDANASHGGDGSKSHPFFTLEAGTDAAAKVATQVTIVLRGGVYYTKGIVLSAAHSGLTIQNFEGEEATVSGAIPVPVSKDKWSLHAASTNTWRLDLSAWQEMPLETFGMRVGSDSVSALNASTGVKGVKRAVRARFPNGDPEIGTGYSMNHLNTFPRTHADVKTTKNYFAAPSDWPGVFWLNESEGGYLPWAGHNSGGSGTWFGSSGGVCSGRQVHLFKPAMCTYTRP